MPKTLSRKHAADYESDGGFVEDAAPKNKKQRSGDFTTAAAVAKSKGATAAAAGGVQKDDEGNEYWEISGKRRVQVSEFKNATFVGVREFYEKDGKALPGKKGIALSVDQYKAFIELLPQIEAVLSEKGIDVPRPKYPSAAAASSSKAGNEQDEEDGGAEEEEDAEGVSKGKLDKFRMKANHEATSDEEE